MATRALAGAGGRQQGFMDHVGARLLLDREGKRDVSIATVKAGRLTGQDHLELLPMFA